MQPFADAIRADLGVGSPKAARIADLHREIFMNAVKATAHLVFAAMAVAMLCACITRPTVDVTKAPFRASTELSEAPIRASSELTNGTSRAMGELTEPTRDFTSSTSPGAWFTGDGLLKAEHKVMAFAVYNFDNLKEDMAQGRGQYLASLAALIGVPADRQARFFTVAQSRYPVVYADGVEP